MTNPGLPSSMSTKDDDQESIDLGQLNISLRSYRVPILGGPLIALVLMEKFDLKFAVKWFFRFSIMPGGCDLATCTPSCHAGPNMSKSGIFHPILASFNTFS